MARVPLGRLWWGGWLLAAAGLAALSAGPAAAQDAPARLARRFLELVQEQGLAPDQVALLVLSERHKAVLVQHRAGELMPAASNTKLVTAYAALRALSPNFRWRTRIFRIAIHDGAGDAERQGPAGLLIEGSGDPTMAYADLETVAQRLRAAGLRKLPGGLYLDESAFGAVPPMAKSPAELEPSGLPDEPDGAGETLPRGADQTAEPLPRGADQTAERLPRGADQTGERLPPSADQTGEGLPPSADGDEAAGQTPPQAFIVERNAPEFLIALAEPGGTPEVLSRFPAEALRIVNRLHASPTRRSVIRVEQSADGAQTVFSFSGSVPAGTHTLAVAVDDPAALFANALRAALHRQGIEGALPLHRQAPAGARRALLFSHYSPALREAIGPILRDSDNLAADTLLWTLAVQARQDGRGGPPELQDGLRWVTRIVQQDFPGIQGEVELADGSGLNADSRFSARALVRVLSGALARPDFGPEFKSALSRAGWDGTLHYRAYPPALAGHLRAKTGTLPGVQNLTGTFPLAQDEIVFAFLIAAPGQPRLKLQAAQDKIVAELFALLRQEEIVAPERDPLAPRVLKPPPPSVKPSRKRPLQPPAPSPKPKAGGSGEQTSVG